MAIVNDVELSVEPCFHCAGQIRVVVQMYMDGGIGSVILAHIDPARTDSELRTND